MKHNSGILLWFIRRKKHRNQKYDLFPHCSHSHFGRPPTPFDKNPLNVLLNELCTSTHTSARTLTDTQRTCKNFREVSFGSGFLFFTFWFARLHISIRGGGTKRKQETVTPTGRRHETDGLSLMSGRMTCCNVPAKTSLWKVSWYVAAGNTPIQKSLATADFPPKMSPKRRSKLRSKR